MSKKRIIVIVISILCVLAILGTVYLVSEKQTEKKEKETTTEEKVFNNYNPEVIRDGQFQGLLINNVRLSIKGNVSTFEATLTNTTNEAISSKTINIVFKDKKGDVVQTMPFTVQGPIEPGKFMDISSSAEVKFTEDVIYSVEYQ